MEVFETPGPVTIEAKIPTGRVVVTTTDAPVTEVDVVPLSHKAEDAVDKIRVSHAERSGRHVITIEQRNRIEWGPIQITWGADVEVRVRCPVGADLELSGAATDFRADGSYGRVEARTASGDVELAEITEKLEVKTASGDVVLERVAGESATVTTVSGDVVIQATAADLSLRTISGDVVLGAVRAPVLMSTTSGDVKVRSLEDGDLRVQSVSGDCRIGVAQGTRVWIDATSVSGDLRSDLEMNEGLADAEIADDSDVVPVQAKTVSGDVAILRAAAPVG